jgi:hypothetical protein
MRRAAFALVSAWLVSGIAAPGVGAANLSGAGDAGAAKREAVPLALARTAGSAGGMSPCSDPAYTLIGGRWKQTYHWAFTYSSVPASLGRAAVETVIKRSVSNITGARNDCGMPDNVSAKHVYDGRTSTQPGISRWATCDGSDGWNVIGFGRLPKGVLAVTCTDVRHGSIVEADIRINSRYNWAVSTAKCFHQELIEPTLTHEVGHVFGLGHVGERRHPLLTMSTASDGPCSDDASTLARGDVLGLEKLY